MMQSKSGKSLGGILLSAEGREVVNKMQENRKKQLKKLKKIEKKNREKEIEENNEQNQALENLQTSEDDRNDLVLPTIQEIINLKKKKTDNEDEKQTKGSSINNEQGAA